MPRPEITRIVGWRRAAILAEGDPCAVAGVTDKLIGGRRLQDQIVLNQNICQIAGIDAEIDRRALFETALTKVLLTICTS